MRPTLILLAVLALTACSSTAEKTPPETVQIESYARPGITFQGTYAIGTIPADDSLRFASFLDSITPLIDAKGYTRIAPGKGSDIVILVSWPPPETISVPSSRSMPTMSTSMGRVVPNSNGGTTFVPGTTNFGNTYVPSTLLFSRGGLSLRAFPSGSDGKEELWSIAVWTVSRNPLDPHRDYPRLLAAASAYIGRASGGRIELPLPPAAQNP